jgi:hypothetical protein
MGKKKSNQRTSNVSEDLRNKLKSKMGNMKHSRNSGLPTQAQSVMKGLDSEDPSQREMIDDMTQEMKGMKPSQAKKYLKNLMSGMSSQQTSSLEDMVKEKMPNQSQEVLHMVETQKKSQKLEQEREPEFKSVYVPSCERSLPGHTVSPIKDVLSPAYGNRKKKFGKISINIPKISDLSKADVTPSSKPLVQLATSTDSREISERSLEGLHKLFEELPELNLPVMEYVQFSSREIAVKKFTTKNMVEKRLEKTLMCGPEENLYTVVSVEDLPLPDVMKVPNSEKVVSEEFLLENKSLRCPISYVCEKNDLGGIVVIRNCIDECKLFLNRGNYTSIRNWVRSCVNKRVPTIWLYSELNKLGIMRKVSEAVCVRNPKTLETVWTDSFYVYGREYLIHEGKISVPEIPFFKLKIRSTIE